MKVRTSPSGLIFLEQVESGKVQNSSVLGVSFLSPRNIQVYYLSIITSLVSCHILVVLIILIASTNESKSITNMVWFELKFDMTMYEIYFSFSLYLNFL